LHHLTISIMGRTQSSNVTKTPPVFHGSIHRMLIGGAGDRYADVQIDHQFGMSAISLCRCYCRSAHWGRSGGSDKSREVGFFVRNMRSLRQLPNARCSNLAVTRESMSPPRFSKILRLWVICSPQNLKIVGSDRYLTQTSLLNGL